jgi:hypothetical protein
MANEIEVRAARRTVKENRGNVEGAKFVLANAGINPAKPDDKEPAPYFFGRTKFFAPMSKEAARRELARRGIGR